MMTCTVIDHRQKNRGCACWEVHRHTLCKEEKQGSEGGPVADAMPLRCLHNNYSLFRQQSIASSEVVTC
jgi:hypothetical protein